MNVSKIKDRVPFSEYWNTYASKKFKFDDADLLFKGPDGTQRKIGNLRGRRAGVVITLESGFLQHFLKAGREIIEAWEDWTGFQVEIVEVEKAPSPF